MNDEDGYAMYSFSRSSTVSDAAQNNRGNFTQLIGINISKEIMVVSSAGNGGTTYVKPPISSALIIHQ